MTRAEHRSGLARTGEAAQDPEIVGVLRLAALAGVDLVLEEQRGARSAEAARLIPSTRAAARFDRALRISSAARATAAQRSLTFSSIAPIGWMTKAVHCNTATKIQAS